MYRLYDIYGIVTKQTSEYTVYYYYYYQRKHNLFLISLLVLPIIDTKYKICEINMIFKIYRLVSCVRLFPITVLYFIDSMVTGGLTITIVIND